MDWDQIRIFLAVVRAGQFVAAARRLELDHTTVGRRITALEQELGAKLFNRSTTGVALSTLGERLLQTAEAMETAMDNAVVEFSQAESRVTGAVRIGTPDGLGTYYLARRLAELADKNPELRIQLVPIPRTFSLARREADLAITIERPVEGRLTSLKLSDYTLGAYVSRDHIKRFGAIKDYQDLKDRVLVTYVSDLIYSSTLEYAEPLEKFAAKRFECASLTSQLEVVRSGIGVGILHDYAARAFGDLVKILPSFSVKRNYWLVAHKDVRMIRRISFVHEFITSEFKNSGRGFFCPS